MTTDTDPNKKTLTHIDKNNQPTMVDVSKKTVTLRRAEAITHIDLPPEVQAALEGGEINSKKGPVFQTAIIAGVMAAKKTHELIPFCHPINIESCKIHIKAISPSQVEIRCIAQLHAKTGVEMEALTGASVAALTVYDMCKALSHDIVISQTRLVQKSGGKSDITEADITKT